MQFVPYVFYGREKIFVSVEEMTIADAERTNAPIAWQTSWTSNFLQESRFKKYAAKCGEELVALGAYEILKDAVFVHIAYIEAQPESNPTMDCRQWTYRRCCVRSQNSRAS